MPHAELPLATVHKQFHAVAAAMRSVKDMHVAACAHAIFAGSYYPQVEVVSLVTNNIRDFGVRRLAALGIKVMRPDAFLLDLFLREADGVASAFAALRATLRSARTPERLLDRLSADGQVRTAAAMLAARRQGEAIL